MGRKTKFKIVRFTNPSGERAFRVTGSLEGRQIRRNFKTRQDAVAERGRLEIKQLNGSTEGRFLWVKMSPEQSDDAWAAIRQLKEAGIDRSLGDAVQYYIEHYRPVEVDTAAEDAVAKYIASREADLFSGSISFSQFKSLRSRMRQFGKHFNVRRIAEIQTEDLEELLSQGKTSPKTWNNNRGYLNTFFEYCVDSCYVATNPVKAIKIHRIKSARGTADTLTIEKATSLMRFAEGYEGHALKNGSSAGRKGCLVPFFALTLFAGVRPDWREGEISKIKPKDIVLETNTIHVEPDVSKTDEKRIIQIQPNLKKWLQAYPLTEYPVIPFRNFEKSISEVRKRHGLSHDVLRHTFISMHIGKFRSVGDAALEAGNSDSIIRRHYLDVITKKDAGDFWEIGPRNLPPG